MTSLRDVFELLVDLPVAEREARLRELDLGAEPTLTLQAMLNADAQPAHLVDLPLETALETLRAGSGTLETRLVGTRVGPFRILELLGEGGSSSVFRAERAAGSGSQIVALKVLRSGLFSSGAARRFERESAILAQLDHPNIARLIEGGVSESGMPYIAMELVEGEPITVAAARRALDVAARLRLFSSLCRAIVAAHAALVIHCDIKPSNVLVDARDHLKVLDFGIAEVMHSTPGAEATHTLTLTPEYAAPEQFLQEFPTVAVDVFALGVLLGELLTGRRVRGRALSSVPSASDWQPPDGLPPARLLARQLRGDLDSIAGMASAEEATRRYASVEALAADVDRYLRGQPVLARAPSTSYRVQKFVARHRTAVALSAAMALALFASLAMALWQAHLARQEAARANAVRDFVVGIFDVARASLPRDQRPTPEVLVAKAAEQFARAELDAQTRADLDRTLGEVWLSMSDYAAADAAFANALPHAMAVGDRPAEQALRVMRADGWQRSGRNDEAVQAIEPLLESLRERPSLVLVRALRVLAMAQMQGGDLDGALQHQREAAAITGQMFGPDHLETIHARLNVGGVLTVAGRYPEALEIIEPLLARWHALGGPQDERYATVLTNLVVSTLELGRAADAEARLRELLALRRRIYPGVHESIAKTLRDLAALSTRTGDYREAEALAKEALDMQRQVLGPDHIEVAKTHDALGVALVNQARFEEARAQYLAAIAVCERSGARVDVCARAHNNLGQAYHREKRPDDAAREIRIALAMRIELQGRAHPFTAYSMSRLAIVEADRGDAAAAIELSNEALAALEAAGQGDTREGAFARYSRAHAMEASGDHERALPEIEHAVQQWRKAAPEDMARLETMLTLQGRLLRQLGRPEEAARILEEARGLRSTVDEARR